MSLYLNDIVVCGEIINTTKNSVHGWLYLCDREVPLPLHLTGNCAPDLAGRHIRFEARRPHPAEDSASIADALASQQVGPTGVITANRKVRVLDDTEVTEDSSPRKRPKSRWKQCLYLEWFSQNGRVVVELVDPRIEFVEEQDESVDDLEDDADTDVVSDEGIDDNDDEDSDSEDSDSLDAQFDEPDDDDDPYGLFSGEEGASWRSSADEEDDAPDAPDGINGEMLARLADDDETMAELELMDSLIERGAEVPVGSIFDPPIQLPRPEGLNDDQVGIALQKLLAEMARYGIALDMCEHFSPREAYQLLLDEICVEEGAFPELRGTQWVQHFMTHDFCAVCQAEDEAEAHAQESLDDDDDDESDDDVPF